MLSSKIIKSKRQILNSNRRYILEWHTLAIFFLLVYSDNRDKSRAILWVMSKFLIKTIWLWPYGMTLDCSQKFLAVLPWSCMWESNGAFGLLELKLFTCSLCLVFHTGWTSLTSVWQVHKIVIILSCSIPTELKFWPLV